MNKKVVDIFAGAGGLSYGFKSAGFDVIAGIDKEEDFIKAFDSMHGGAKSIVADLYEERVLDLLESRGIGKSDIGIIVGGPPCKGFSTVGDRENSDERNKLVIEFAHAIGELKPELFLMENVTGLTSMRNENGELVIEELARMFDEYGYDIKHKILKAADYGVPQNRERFFIVGMKEGLGAFKWPEPTHVSENSLESHSPDKKTYVTVDEAIGDLPGLSAGEKTEEYIKQPETDYQKRMRDKSDKLLNHKTPNHSDKIVERLDNVPQGGNHQDLPERLQLNSGYSNIYGRLDPKKPADTITGNFGCVSAPGKFIHPENNRGLTVREGARLQSFPDSYEFFGNQSQQYKQVGHAVPPLLSRAIAKEIKKTLNR